MMFINLGTEARDWKNLSEAQQKKLQTGYQEFTATEGVTPGSRLVPPESATTVRV